MDTEKSSVKPNTQLTFHARIYAFFQTRKSISTALATSIDEAAAGIRVDIVIPSSELLIARAGVRSMSAVLLRSCFSVMRP